MNLGNKKTLFIAGGAVAVAILALVFVVVVLGGKKKPADTTSVPASGTQTTTGAPPAPGAPGAPGAPATPGAAGTAGGAAGAASAAATLPAPGTTGGTATAPPAGTQLPGKLWASIQVGGGEVSATSRRDPLVFLQPPPVPILPEQMVQIPTVTLQLGGLRPAGGEEVIRTTPMIANRRVAGVKFDGGAWAILEQDSGTFVVKPGDTIDGVKIKSISREAIYITDAEGEPWIVPLRAAGPGAATPVVSRVSGLPNSPTEF